MIIQVLEKNNCRLSSSSCSFEYQVVAICRDTGNVHSVSVQWGHRNTISPTLGSCETSANDYALVPATLLDEFVDNGNGG